MSLPTASSLKLTWTAPGDDGETGTAYEYDIRYSTSAINEGNWSSTTEVTGEPTPQEAGNEEEFTAEDLDPGTTYYFAIKTSDEVPNESTISNCPSGTTLDITAPAAVINLAVSMPTASSLKLTWTAPGDDGETGTASEYDIRYSTSAINEGNWSSAVQATGEPTPQEAGNEEEFTTEDLNPETTYYFAIKTRDEVPNWSGISNCPGGTTWSEDYWYAGTSLGQELEDPEVYNSKVRVPVNIDWVLDCERQEITNVYFESYEAQATYIYALSYGIEMVTVIGGDDGFSDLSYDINNNEEGDDYTDFSDNGYDQPPTIVARLVPRLIGSALDSHDLSVDFSSMYAYQGVNQEEVLQESPAVKTYKRGDARAEDPGTVDGDDATYVSQYVVGSKTLSDLNALNAACPHHNSPSDYINITDGMYIGQYVNELRDEYFQIFDKGYMGSPPPPGAGDTMVEIGSAELAPEGSAKIPISVKNITDPDGLGCYNFTVVFDPSVIKVNGVLPGDKPFDEPGAVNIDNEKGVVRLADFESPIPGPTGDITVAYLDVTAIGMPKEPLLLDISIPTLSDSIGDDIIAKDVDGTITIK